MSRRLRDYQQALATSHDQAIAGGLRGPAAIAATGLGKGDLIADRANEGTLMIAHREELVSEMAWRVAQHKPHLSVGIVQAERNQSRRQVVSASIQTLKSATRRKSLERPKLVVIDEAHHAAAKSYVDVLTWAGCFDEVDPTPYFGVTATMMRGQPPKRGERGLGDIWLPGSLLQPQLNIRWGVSNGPSLADPYVSTGIEYNGGVGWLVMPKGRCVVTDHMDLEHTEKRNVRGDYQDAELGEMVRQDVDQIVAAWLKHASDRITAAFVPDAAAAEALTAAFLAAGIPAEMVLGTTSRAERGDAKQHKGIYGRLALGVTRVLVGVMVPTEGWDCPQVSCILWARPTLLPGLYIQGVGRGLRPCPEIGKADCLVLDVVGASRRQSLMMAPQLLPGIEYDDTELPDVIPCEQCGKPITACQCLIDAEERGPRVDRRRKLEQPTYEDIDLFADTDINWQVSSQGHRFINIPPSRDRGKVTRPGQYVVLYEESDGTASVAVMGEKGGGRWLHLNTTPTQAQHMAEAEARSLNGTGPGLSRTAPWRIGSPSEGQIRAGHAWRVPNPETMTAGRLSDEIARRGCSEALAATGTEGAA